MTFWDSERSLPRTDSYAEMAGCVSPALCYVREEIIDPGASLEATGASTQGGGKCTNR